MNQKGIAATYILVGILILLGIAGGTYYLGKISSSKIQLPQNNQRACTDEAKICPDGSAVGRTGPNCEFAPCPTTTATYQNQADTSNWKTYRSPKLGFQIKYPSQYFIHDYSNFLHTFISKPDEGYFYITDIDYKTDIRNAKFFIAFTPYENITPTDTTPLVAGCSASGVQGEIFCDRVEQTIAYKTIKGLSGYKLYLHVIETGQQNREYLRGPIYFLEISDIKTGPKSISVSYNKSPTTKETEITDKADLNLFESIVNTMQF